MTGRARLYRRKHRLHSFDVKLIKPIRKHVRLTFRNNKAEGQQCLESRHCCPLTNQIPTAK